MRLRNIILIVLGVVLGIAYILLANSIKTTSTIWVLTRSFGLIAYFLLFLLVLIGELKMLGKPVGFKYHCSIGVLTFYLAMLHGISALFDKFKWGKTLSFIDYLGFNFSSGWMTLLSLGTLAFYLIILVSITSSSKMIRALSFKKWKLIHYLSYAAVLIVFIHSIMLGTDLKHSDLATLLFPLVVFNFSTVTALFITRLMRKVFVKSPDPFTLLVAIMLLSASATYFAVNVRSYNDASKAAIEESKVVYAETQAIKSTNKEYINTLEQLRYDILKLREDSTLMIGRIDKFRNTTNG
jgi:methionine sulfoxide reductase heme-binding subunit